MDELEEQEEGTPTLVTDAVEVGPQTPMEALRARRDEVSKKRDTMIPIAGFESEGLRCQYRLLERGETNDIAKKVRKQTKDRAEIMFRILIDTIIAACEGFYFSMDGEEPQPLISETTKEHVTTYQQYAAELAGEPFTTARKAVLYVFGDNEFTVGDHGLLLSRWLSNTNIDIDEEALEGQ